jgi:hypothetical protein
MHIIVYVYINNNNKNNSSNEIEEKKEEEEYGGGELNPVPQKNATKVARTEVSKT